MIQGKLRSIIEKHGDYEYGFAPLRDPVSLKYYEEWIESEKHAEMSYLKRHLEVKASPELRYPKAHSAIVFRFHYYPSKQTGFPLKETKVALYAQGKDYHDYLKEELQVLLDAFKEEFPEEEFLFHTDSGPVLERDLAYQAGLGWFGKNTCIIDQKKGSLFFIAEILTSLRLPKAEVLHPDRCGTCTRCIDACPTDALSDTSRSLDASRCISYLNIEKKGLPDADLRAQMGSWFFGCDICQTVCPWNEKTHGKPIMQSLTNPETSRDTLISELNQILSSTDSELKELFHGTPLTRAKPKGLRRNAIIVATNENLNELKDKIQFHSSNPDLEELVHWSLERL